MPFPSAASSWAVEIPWRILPTGFCEIFCASRRRDWFVLRLTSPDRQLLNVKNRFSDSSFIGTVFLCGGRSQCKEAADHDSPLPILRK